MMYIQAHEKRSKSSRNKEGKRGLRDQSLWGSSCSPPPSLPFAHPTKTSGREEELCKDLGGKHKAWRGKPKGPLAKPLAKRIYMDRHRHLEDSDGLTGSSRGAALYFKAGLSARVREQSSHQGVQGSMYLGQRSLIDISQTASLEVRLRTSPEGRDSDTRPENAVNRYKYSVVIQLFNI